MPLEVVGVLSYSCVNILTYLARQIQRIFPHSTHLCNGDTL
jgi:hypothetical protein